MKIYADYIKTPIGTIEIIADNEAVLSVNFTSAETTGEIKPNKITATAKRELKEYFNGTRKTFSVPLKTEGSQFYVSVWKALLDIPYGETKSYSEIAKAIGNPKASRAVGSANNRNKIAIIIPCHRVIGKNGKLTGYAAGIWRKQWLLEHEREYK